MAIFTAMQPFYAFLFSILNYSFYILQFDSLSLPGPYAWPETQDSFWKLIKTLLGSVRSWAYP